VKGFYMAKETNTLETDVSLTVAF
jgi:hypothetical protein